MGELMRIERRSERVDQAAEFVSQKSGMLPIPVRHHLLRDALAQAALDPVVRAIEYLPAIQASKTTKVDVIVLDRDDGRYHLEIPEARPRQSIARTLIVAQVLLDLGLRPHVRTESDILREPNCTNARTVWAHADHPVAVGLRLQILGALTDDGAITLGELMSRLRSDRDPAPAVMALAVPAIPAGCGSVRCSFQKRSSGSAGLAAQDDGFHRPENCIPGFFITR
jgi:hypothetical protein